MALTIDPAAASAPAFDTLQIMTARLRLRPLADSDAEALLGIFGDPQVMRYWSTPPWTGLDDAHEMIQRDRAALSLGHYVRLGLERVGDATLIGACTLFDLHPTSRRAEMGYALAAAAWGQGYMDEALRALLAFGFDDLGLNRVEADIDPRNEASARALQRLGFRQEGLLRERWIVAGEVSDSALYGLLRADWAGAA